MVAVVARRAGEHHDAAPLFANRPVHEKIARVLGDEEHVRLAVLQNDVVAGGVCDQHGGLPVIAVSVGVEESIVDVCRLLQHAAVEDHHSGRPVPARQIVACGQNRPGGKDEDVRDLRVPLAALAGVGGELNLAAHRQVRPVPQRHAADDRIEDFVAEGVPAADVEESADRHRRVVEDELAAAAGVHPIHLSGRRDIEAAGDGNRRVLELEVGGRPVRHVRERRDEAARVHVYIAVVRPAEGAGRRLAQKRGKIARRRGVVDCSARLIVRRARRLATEQHSGRNSRSNEVFPPRIHNKHSPYICIVTQTNRLKHEKCAKFAVKIAQRHCC